MMAHSLTNAKAARFMQRTSEFSTHGNRRGFVDIDLPIPKDQLEPCVVDTTANLPEAIRILEAHLQIPDGMSYQQYKKAIMQARHKYPIRYEHLKTLKTLKYQLRQAKRKSKKTKPKAKEWV